jgi:mono/diheme cytochrome c family protein
MQIRLGVLALAGFVGIAGSVEPRSVPLSTLRAVDLAGKAHQPAEADGTRAVAFVFLSTECPISNQYVPELNRIHDRFAGQPVEIFGVISDRSTSRARAVEFAKEFGIRMTILFDASGAIATHLQPTHVPQAVVVDSLGQVAYSGRIDDQYASNLKRKTAASTHELVDALAALIEGKSPAVAETQPVGCRLEAKAITREGAPTFNRDVAPILYAHCTQCHRSGEVAPFEILSYSDAVKRAEYIAEVTSAKRMPPWKAEPGFGHFLGERILNSHDIQVLVDWHQAGAPEGNKEDLPPAPEFVDGWQLGQPDLVVKMPVAYTVPADGPDINRFFVFPINVPSDVDVVAVEFRPGNPRVVHHAIMYTDRSGEARRRDEATPEPGYEGFVATFRGNGGGVLGFWAPGYTPRFNPQNAGQRLYTNTDMALQLHYHPSGKEEIDQSQVGIYFAKSPIAKVMGGAALINFNVDIPAGEPRHQMSHSFTTPVDLDVVGIVPHMHMIGTLMTAQATLPDGKVIPLIKSHWDFNWQDVYRFRDVIKLPAGTKIDVEAKFDNSAANPYNPNSPPKLVGFGEQTTDEMLICALSTIHEPESPERRILSEALREDMTRQLKNPKVFISVTRFMMSGGGGVNPLKLVPKTEKSAKTDS